MGPNPLQQYKLYWHQNDFIGNSGVKNGMQKISKANSQYLHVSDRDDEPA